MKTGLKTICCCCFTVPPSFTSLPVNQTIKEGEAATFHCSVSGNPMPKVKWYRGGKVVGEGDTLRIPGANKNDSGEYWCSADNSLAVNINASGHLNVQCKSEDSYS